MTSNRMASVSRLLLFCMVLMVCTNDWAAQTKPRSNPKFVLASPDLHLTAKVPEEYTANVFGCTGGNMSPPLQWSGEPAGKSYVVTLFDADEHSGPSGWWHWIVYNLPANVRAASPGRTSAATCSSRGSPIVSMGSGSYLMV